MGSITRSQRALWGSPGWGDVWVHGIRQWKPGHSRWVETVLEAYTQTKQFTTSSNSTIRDEAGDKGVEARRASGQEPGGAKTKLMVSDRGLRLLSGDMTQQAGSATDKRSKNKWCSLYSGGNQAVSERAGEASIPSWLVIRSRWVTQVRAVRLMRWAWLLGRGKWKNTWRAGVTVQTVTGRAHMGGGCPWGF